MSTIGYVASNSIGSPIQIPIFMLQSEWVCVL